MRKTKGITVVSPMWGERSVTDRMVFSVIHQYLGHENPLNIELILVDDYFEGKDRTTYDYYISEEFKKFYDTEHISIKLIKNEEHKYQGESREIGFMAGKYDWFVLLDCDDMLAPNCLERFRTIINSYAEDEKDNLACVYGMLYSFAERGYEQNILGESIWVQSRCFNRKFIVENDIHFPTGLGSRQGEDYPFIRKFDYALMHDKKWNGVKIPYGEGKDCQATAFWFPNEDSLSRQDPHYTCHLSGWTIASSNSIIEYYMDYNRKHGIEDEEDESMKHELLNMVIYSFYNFLNFLREVASKGYVPIKEDWEVLKINAKSLRNKLRDTFWDEIVYSDIEDMLHAVKHHSDIQFCESWLGTFYDYMNEGFYCKLKNSLDCWHKWELLDLPYDKMMEYCGTLEFDEVGHEIHSKQVVAWRRRHNVSEDKG